MPTKDFIRHRLLRRPYKLMLRYDTGRGRPVVLLHGLASNSNAWKHLARQADYDKWRIIAFDLLGFGESPKPGWLDYNIDHHARAVATTIKSIKLNHPVILVGHSMGCLVAIHLAEKYPKLIEKIILYEPPLFADLPEFRKHSRNRKRYFALYGRIAGNPKAVIRYTRSLGRIAARLPGHNLNAETWLPFERSLRNTIMEQTAYSELLHLKKPVDIVYGRLDLIISRSEIRQILKNNSNITIHMVNDSHSISSRSARFILKLLER